MIFYYIFLSTRNNNQKIFTFGKHMAIVSLLKIYVMKSGQVDLPIYCFFAILDYPISITLSANVNLDTITSKYRTIRSLDKKLRHRFRTHNLCHQH